MSYYSTTAIFYDVSNFANLELNNIFVMKVKKDGNFADR